MIGIASVSYDAVGWRVFHGDPVANDLGNRGGARRVSRTATLGGGCVVYDTCYTDSDRTITVTVPSPKTADLYFADHVCRNCPRVWIFTREGVFAGVPERHAVTGGVLKITILVTDRLDA